MRAPRALAGLLLASLLVLSACGGDSDDESAPGDSGGGSSAEPGGEDVGGGAGDEPEAEQVDICTVLTPDEVGTALGGAVTVSEIPGGGCTFNQEDARAPSVAINSTPLDPGNGGFEGTRAGIGATIDGDVEDLDGIADGAFVAVGPALGGSSAQGGGAVLVGGTIVQVTLLQAQELPADEVRTLAVDVLTLIGSKG